MDNIRVDITMKQLRRNLGNLNPTDYIPAKRILAMTNNEILRDIQEKVNTLTFEFLKKEYDSLENISNEQDLKQFGSMSELCTDYYEMETSLQIIRLFASINISLNIAQAYHIWSEVSDSLHSIWLIHSEDNKAFAEIIIHWVYEY